MDDRNLEQALRRWGRTAFAFDALQARERYAFYSSQRVPGAAVPYRQIGSVDAVVGEPLCPEEALPEVVAEFLASRQQAGRRVLGFCASEAFARAAVAAGAAAAQMTSEPELDPATYEPVGGSAKKLRVYVRRLRRQGIEATGLPAGTAQVPAEFRRDADALIDLWRRRAVGRAAHILEVDPWLRAAEKRYFAVYDPKTTDRMWSLLIAHPVYPLDGWHLCHLIRDPEAPKGVTELVVMSAIETLGDEGVRYATFGPFASPRAGEFLGFGRIAEGLVRRAYDFAATTGGYGSSVEFYRKVQAGPWRPRYMIIFPRRAVVRCYYALLRLSHVFGFLGQGEGGGRKRGGVETAPEPDAA